MIWSVSRMVIRRLLGRDKILVIHGIGIFIYLGFWKESTPIPTMHWRWYNERNVMYCLWCVGQRIKHRHFMGHRHFSRKNYRSYSRSTTQGQWTSHELPRLVWKWWTHSEARSLSCTIPPWRYRDCWLPVLGSHEHMHSTFHRNYMYCLFSS